MSIKINVLRSNGHLFIAAAIWGSGFVAQRIGMEHVGPCTFNALRFLLGSIVLLPILYFSLKNEKQKTTLSIKNIIVGGTAAGIFIFLGATFQQTGLVYTTACKAGFITGLYVILVPILGIFLNHKAGPGTWAGTVFAVLGLYLLSFANLFTTATLGDLLVLIGALFWAGHVHVLGYYSPNMNTILLACIQFVTCSLLSFLAIPLFNESLSVSSLAGAAPSLCYSGCMSVGIAFTLQVVGQKHVKPAHAAIILSLEAVFAALFGVLMLGEILTVRGLYGCVLMFSGMIVSQVWGTEQ